MSNSAPQDGRCSVKETENWEGFALLAGNNSFRTGGFAVQRNAFWFNVIRAALVLALLLTAMLENQPSSPSTVRHAGRNWNWLPEPISAVIGLLEIRTTC